MPYRLGRGYGFRGSAPEWPYVGRGRGGLPRCGYFGASSAVPNGQAAVLDMRYGRGSRAPNYDWPEQYGAQMGRREELEFLKEEATAVKAQLDEIQARIEVLDSD